MYLFKKSDKDKSKEDELIKDSEINKLIKIALKKIILFAKTGQISKSPGMAFLLYRWKEWKNIDEPKKYVGELLKTPTGMASYIKGFTAQSTSNGKLHYRISYKELKTFIDLRSLKDKIEQLKNKDKKLLNKEEVERLDNFMKDIDKALEGKEDLF